MVTRSDKTNDSLDNEIILDAVCHPLVHGDLHGSLSMSSRPIFRKAPTNSFAFLKLKIKILLQEFVTSRNTVFLLTSHVQSLLSIAWEAGTTIPQIWFSIEGSEPKNVTLPRLWLHVWVTVHSGLLMIGLQFLTHLYSIIHMLQLSAFIHLLLSKFGKLESFHFKFGGVSIF